MSRQTQIILRASTTSGGATATTTGAAQKIGQSFRTGNNFRQLTAFLDVTALAAAAGDKLNVYIDVSPDGGTTWANVGHFTEVVGNGTAKKEVMTINGIAAAGVVNVTSDQASGTVVDIGFFDTIRYRAIITDAGATASSFTYAVYAFVK